MLLSNAIAKAKKLTGADPIQEGQFYIFTYKGYTLQFAQNGRADEATGFYTKKIGIKDDPITDYFPGTFHDNLTKAFNFINR